MDELSRENYFDVDRGAPKVLLAEDDFLIRLDIGESLRALGWEVVDVASADAGLEVLGAGLRFDILLSDINMSGDKDGTELARAVRQHYPHVRIALMSGLMRPDSVPHELYDIFLAKPVLDIVSALARLMNSSTLSR